MFALNFRSSVTINTKKSVSDPPNTEDAPIPDRRKEKRAGCGEKS